MVWDSLHTSNSVKDKEILNGLLILVFYFVYYDAFNYEYYMFSYFTNINESWPKLFTTH